MLLYYSKSTTFDYILLASLDELSDLNTKLGNKKSKMDKITVDLALREEEIQKLEQKLDQKLIIFNNRIRCIYKNNDKNILEVFFKSIDFIEFLSRLKMMRLFAKQDAQAISEIK
jgi:peptidoglycan hydrolase CwlO-like protein